MVGALLRQALYVLLLCILPSCDADKQSRRLIIKNQSGESVNLSWINATNGEHILKEEGIQDGAGVALFGWVEDDYEIKSDTQNAVVFRLEQTFDGRAISSQVTIERGLDLSVEDFVSRERTSALSKEDFQRLYPDRLKINEDLSVLSKIDTVTRVREMDTRRFNWQMKIFFHKPIVGLIENKLLSTALLISMGIPTANIYYGSFYSKSMGGWPKYNRNEFIEAMKSIPEVAENHHFVLKPTTSHGCQGVYVMNDLEWNRTGMTFERLADVVEADFIVHSHGMKYDHRGIMIAASALPQEVTIHWADNSFDLSQKKVPVFELKTHVTFGKLCAARIQTVPIQFEGFVDITFCNENDEPSFYFATGLLGAQEELWEVTRPVIVQNKKRIADIAQQLTDMYGLDLFRLDVFMDGEGLFIVNEVTYPSFSHDENDCANERLLDAYRMGDFDILNATSTLTSLLQRINVSYDDFMDTRDFQELGNPEVLDMNELENFDYFKKADEGDQMPKHYRTGRHVDDLERDFCLKRTELNTV